MPGSLRHVVLHDEGKVHLSTCIDKNYNYFAPFMKAINNKLGHHQIYGLGSLHSAELCSLFFSSYT
jgi:hypothetical protein